MLPECMTVLAKAGKRRKKNVADLLDGVTFNVDVQSVVCTATIRPLWSTLTNANDQSHKILALKLNYHSLLGAYNCDFYLTLYGSAGQIHSIKNSVVQKYRPRVTIIELAITQYNYVKIFLYIVLTVIKPWSGGLLVLKPKGSRSAVKHHSILPAL